MKIAFICNEYPAARHGGIGGATRTLAQGLVQAGHQVRVIGYYPKTESAPEFECDGAVKVWRYKTDSANLRWISARRWLYRTIGEWAQAGEIDVLEAPDFDGVLAGWPSLPVPVIVRLHGSSSYFAAEMGQNPKWQLRVLERASLVRADFRCSCSRYTAERTQSLFQLTSAKATVLYNSVNISDKPAQTFRIPGRVVFTGTLTDKKGVISLIRAWSLVSQEVPRARLHLFGRDGRTRDGGSMQQYLLTCVSPEARTTIHFHGNVEQAKIRSALQSANVAVFPSYSEAFALAPMEAMAEACPTIYSHRASGTELIEHGRNGLLIGPDDVEGIARSILRILRDQRLAAELGREGRETILDRFSPAAMIQKNIDFYEQCIRTFRRTESEPGSRPESIAQIAS